MFNTFVEEVCLCNRTWRGKVGCSFSCPDCGFDCVDEAAFEEWEEKRRERIVRENEY